MGELCSKMGFKRLCGRALDVPQYLTVPGFPLCCSEVEASYKYGLAGSLAWEVWPLSGDDTNYECALRSISNVMDVCSD